uniref:FYVE-type domain-containing protein n=1 Tax=Hyaloperonospora arabidopsidis (strain Emoy2) TaxID=559515 RepID=M4BGG7_HYAAE
MASAVHLSCDRDQTRRLHRRAMRQITNTLKVCLNSTRTKEQWSRLRRDKHEELYAKSIGRGTSTNGPSSVYYLAVNEASCGFEEAFDLLQIDSTARFRLLMKLLHGRDFKDGVLTAMGTNDHHALGELAATDTQHAAIWFIYQDHRKSVLLRDQHLTFFQTLKVFLPDTQQLQHHDQGYQNAAASLSAASLLAGRSARPTGGVHKRTIALSWLPLPRSQDVVRETARQVDLQYTLIIEEISANRLRLSCVTSSSPDDYDGSLTGSPWAARAIARRLALRSVGKFEAAVAASRIGGCQFVAPHQWVKNEDRASCVICWKRFNALFRRRHHCRLCGEVICGSCSSLRTTNVVNVKTRAAQKTRICHMCHNEARLKTGTHTFSSINSNHKYDSSSKIPSSDYRPRAQPPLLESDSESELPLLSQVLLTNLNDVTAPDLEVLSPSVALMASERTMTENLEASSTIHEFKEAEMDSYIGALPDRSTDAVVSSKIISIKSITRRTRNFWQAMPSTTSRNKGRWPFQVLDSSSSVNSTCSVHSSDWTGGRNSTSGGVEALTFEGNTSRSFLHPSAVTSKSKRTTQPMCITAEASSYSSVERSCRSSYELVDSKEQDEDDSRWFAYRRTSMMSSNAGLLDQESTAYEGYFLPALNISRETERLKLLELIVSPACTLVDRTIMHRSCEIAAAAFGLSAAFIARVDEAFVRIEHSIGTCGLSPQEEILRRESLCDFVLCQPQDQPLVVLDCLADPRTRDIPMVQHLCMRFFIGISVCVRGLPIACLCVFEQDDGNRCEGDEELVSASHYELGILKNAACRMEDELESLVHGLELC